MVRTVGTLLLDGIQSTAAPAAPSSTCTQASHRQHGRWGGSLFLEEPTRPGLAPHSCQPTLVLAIAHGALLGCGSSDHGPSAFPGPKASGSTAGISFKFSQSLSLKPRSSPDQDEVMWTGQLHRGGWRQEELRGGGGSPPGQAHVAQEGQKVEQVVAP